MGLINGDNCRLYCDLRLIVIMNQHNRFHISTTQIYTGFRWVFEVLTIQIRRSFTEVSGSRDTDYAIFSKLRYRVRDKSKINPVL